MIRPARSVDAPELVSILRERHTETRYAGNVEIDDRVAKRLFAHAVQRHEGTTEGAMYLMVAERNERIEAFILANLVRVYIVGDKLASSDIFLLSRKDSGARHFPALIDGYIAWASGNPRVFEIGLGWSDAIPGNEGVKRAFERRGFAQRATTYLRRNGSKGNV